MARTDSITVKGRTYEVGWNESGWFAERGDGVSTRYCSTLEMLKAAVAAGEWDEDEDEDHVCDDDCRSNGCKAWRDDFNFEPDSDDMRLVAELAGVGGDEYEEELRLLGYCDLGGEGGAA